MDSDLCDIYFAGIVTDPYYFRVDWVIKMNRPVYAKTEAIKEVQATMA